MLARFHRTALFGSQGERHPEIRVQARPKQAIKGNGRNGLDTQVGGQGTGQRGFQCRMDLFFLRILLEMAELERIFTDILASSREFSLYASIEDLKARHKTNPDFEFTLKGNAENNYCRSFITELFTGVYQPELEACRQCFADAVKEGRREWKFAADPRIKEIRDKFYETPLRDLVPDPAAAAKRLPANLKKFADRFEALLPVLKS